MMIENKKKTYVEAVVGLVKVKEEKAGKEDITWKDVVSKQAARKQKKVQRVEASAAAAPIKANDRQRKAWTTVLIEEKCSAEVCSKKVSGNRYKCGGCKDR